MTGSSESSRLLLQARYVAAIADARALLQTARLSILRHRLYRDMHVDVIGEEEDEFDLFLHLQVKGRRFLLGAVKTASFDEVYEAVRLSVMIDGARSRNR